MRTIAIILSIIANSLFIYTGRIKDKQKMFKLQTLETGLSMLKNILFGGYAGAAAQSVGLLRNYTLSKTQNPSKQFMWILIVLQIILGTTFNERGLLGYLPIIASTSYTYINFTTKDIVVTKLSLIANTSLWGIYFYIIGDYVSMSVSIVTFILTSLSLRTIRKTKKTINVR